MGKPDSSRVEHDNNSQPTIFRDDEVSQILDDISEDMSGKGFIEYIRTGSFITSIIWWTSSGKTQKRAQVGFARTSNLISSMLYEIFNEGGTAVVATSTYTVTRQSNKQVIEVQTVNARM